MTQLLTTILGCRTTSHGPSRDDTKSSRLIGTSTANLTHNAAVGEQSCSVGDG
jgi:hypothetical protein